MLLFPYLLNIESILSRYVLLCCGLFGWIGCIINLIVFSQKLLRKEVCSIYIIGIHIVYFFLIPYGCGKTVIIAYLTSISPHRTSLFCKITVYLHHILLNIARSYSVLACFDRYIVTSPNARIRKIRSVSIAMKFVLFIPLVWMISAVHLIFYFDSILSQRCSPIESYAFFLTIYSTIITSGHLTLMILFTLMALYNLHQTRQRVQPMIQQRNIVLPIRRQDLQLMKMIFAETIVYLIGTMFFPVFMIYSIVTRSQTKTFNQYAINLFVSFLTTDFFINLNSCSTFYIYFCVSTTFRKCCKQFLIRCSRCTMR